VSEFPASTQWVRKQIRSSVRIVEIGPGIRPQSFIHYGLGVAIDPYAPYLEVLRENNYNGLLVNAKAMDALPLFMDNSFDTLFALDVIEHMEREEGLAFLEEAGRVASQIVIFTPLGPMPQKFEEQDAWGMGGGQWQNHHSAWTPEDFPGWKLRVLKDFHAEDAHGDVLDPPISAFWAVS
jgi:hypothetical protein